MARLGINDPFKNVGKQQLSIFNTHLPIHGVLDQKKKKQHEFLNKQTA